jgi:hypothetical protein
LRIQHLGDRTAALAEARAVSDLLSYPAFVAAARGPLSTGPGAIALVRVPTGPQQLTVVEAFRFEVRRRDIVGRYNDNHLALLLPGMTAGAARDRLRDVPRARSCPSAGSQESLVPSSDSSSAARVLTVLNPMVPATHQVVGKVPGSRTTGRGSSRSGSDRQLFQGITLAMEACDEAAARVPQRDERVVLIHARGRILPPPAGTTFWNEESSYSR